MQVLNEHKAFGGRQIQCQHHSSALSCDMRFSVFLPPQAAHHKVPALYWLSGLTCTDENFSQKAGAQRMAALLGMALVMPDTSPRGEAVPDDPEQAYDLGLGAGFYLNATQEPWSTHYRMQDYVVSELIELIESEFAVTQIRSLSGHSMGGHGALTLGLKHPQLYKSLSAFSPISHPTNCDWGKKAFLNYLGDSAELWAEHDAALLLAKGSELPILVDQGAADSFYEQGQLQPETLHEAALAAGLTNVEVRMQQGYDHSYYFVASFIEEHLQFHAKHMGLLDS